ncbi:MAG TPA: AraC family transcriptional regulator [Xanthobacteraceae bacterium]|nr:AraC family transcriptional regulator [Xanthobacteraceae bacterium]
MSQEQRSLTRVSADDLASSALVAGDGFKITDPDLSGGDTALTGDYRLVRLRSGLILHATDTIDTHNLTNEIIQHPGITCSLFLEGRVAVEMGDRKFDFGPGKTTEYSKLEGTVVARARPERFVRHSRRGMHVRKVNVTVTREWLERDELGLSDSAVISRFSYDHLACVRWKPSPRLVAIAEQILHPPAYTGLLKDLYLESRAIEIVAEAMHAIVQPDPVVPSSTLRPHDRQRIAKVRELIDNLVNQPFTLESIARESGMSTNTLQRTFHAAYGMTVFDYVRRSRLQRARDAIEREGVNIAQAAHIAGYTSAANFATAFKRLYGMTPKAFRSTV